MRSVRRAAVAGLFYPSDAGALRETIRSCLAEGAARARGPRPKALVVPHAGYVYSGPVAGAAYALLEASAGVERVLLLGPSHRVPLLGLALSSADAFETPLGRVELDRDARDAIEPLAQVVVLDAAHQQEHSLEVQLPFLQELLPRFALLPISVGDASAEEVAEVIERLWGGDETLVLVSSDLSHYHDYETARRLDAETTRAIEELRPEGLDLESACGRVPLRGLLLAAARRGLRARTLDLRNSGDTAGPRDRVVGYGAYAFS